MKEGDYCHEYKMLLEMESRKFSRPNSEDEKCLVRSKPLAKHNSNPVGKGKRIMAKDLCRSRTPPSKFSLIPKLRSDDSPIKPSEVDETTLNSFRGDTPDDELREKLRLIEAKEKSVAEYYEKIEELNKKMSDFQKESAKFEISKIPRSTVCSTAPFLRNSVTESRPDIPHTDPVKSEILSNFEKSIHQISEVWLRTSSDLSNILSNLRNNSSMTSFEFQKENARIQLVIKQAKSLTLIKTKHVIAEAKRLFHSRCEANQSESDNVKKDDTVENYKSGDDGSKKACNGGCSTPQKKNRDACKEEKGNIPNEVSEKKTRTRHPNCGQSQSYSNAQAKAELAKKNETIIYLNNKIFEFQKACNEHLLENSQLQCKIAEMNEKSQWNQVLWKQLTKLKDRIKGLQQSNKQLEAQKKELELKIANLNQEVDKLTKLNQLFRQQKNMWHGHDKHGSQNRDDQSAKTVTLKGNYTGFESVFLPSTRQALHYKENIVEELKNILVAMKGQENIAHQQTTEFETKIEQFKKAQHT